jgi:hypothetical protein
VSKPPIVWFSALKHELTREDILHAFRNATRAWDFEDGFTMVIGASQSAIILEVRYVRRDAAPVIVHAMRAREKFLR